MEEDENEKQKRRGRYKIINTLLDCCFKFASTCLTSLFFPQENRHHSTETDLFLI